MASNDTNVIEIGMEGVEMRSNPLLVPQSKLAFARNIRFDEGKIEVRPSFDYADLQVKGQFQGANWFSPRLGFSSQEYSSAPASLSLAVGGDIYLSPIMDGELGRGMKLEGAPVTGDTWMFGAEQYLIVLDGCKAQWWEGGRKLIPSPGIQECSTGESHDTLQEENHENFIPNQSYTGTYTEGRILVALHVKGQNDCSEGTSAVWVSDILGKRGCESHSGDILLMEEQMLPSYGAPLVLPTRMGKTVTMEILPEAGRNGDGLIFDFKQGGVATHSVADTNRETRINAEGEVIQEGWDYKRLSNAGVLQSISAVSRYAVHRLPKDILFRSRFGLHFLKVTLGEGTFNDESTNHLSHDVEPLMRLDTNLDGAAVGHWLDGSRFFATVGLRGNEHYTSSQAARGFVSLNQAARFTEDRTPIPVWEGVWQPDDEVWGVHNFLNAGEMHHSADYGFTASLNDTRIVFGKLTRESDGLDKRGGESRRIEWEIRTRAHSFNGLYVSSSITDGQIELEVDDSTRRLSVDIWSDRCQRWEPWKSISCNETGKTLLRKSLGIPTKDSRVGTWFQFRLHGEGYVCVRRLTVSHKKDANQLDQSDSCVSLKTDDEPFFLE